MKINNLDLNKLKHFLSVYQTRSVRESSRQLGLSPAAISTSIKNLEKVWGKPLFTRVGYRFVPSPTANNLYGEVHQFFENFEKLWDKEINELFQFQGTIKLGAPRGLGIHPLPQVIGSFQKTYPDIQFEVSFGEPKQQLEQILNGDMDFLLCTKNVKATLELEIQPLKELDHSLVLVGSPRLIERAPKNRSLLPWVTHFEQKHQIETWYKKQFGSKAEIKYALVTNDTYSSLSAIRSGVGVGLLPKNMIGRDLNAKTLQILTEGPATSSSTLNLIFLADKKISMKEKKFLDHIKKQMSLMDV